MKHRFQRYIVRTKMLSTFHTRVEYIPRRTIHCWRLDWVHTHTDGQTDRQTKVKTVYPPVSLRWHGGYEKKSFYWKFHRTSLQTCRRTHDVSVRRVISHVARSSRSSCATSWRGERSEVMVNVNLSRSCCTAAPTDRRSVSNSHRPSITPTDDNWLAGDQEAIGQWGRDCVMVSRIRLVNLAA